MRRRALLAALPLLLGPSAWGSNYFLDQITALASRDEIRRLKRVGVRTSDDLAQRAGTSEGRAELRRRTGLSLQRLSLLGAQTDLMRLRGIGPDAARVLVAAGCRGLAELQQSDPQALADAVKRTNDRTRLSTNPPRVENLVAWIEQAQELAPLYQPDT